LPWLVPIVTAVGWDLLIEYAKEATSVRRGRERPARSDAVPVEWNQAAAYPQRISHLDARFGAAGFAGAAFGGLQDTQPEPL
jgi:hypothetical protein